MGYGCTGHGGYAAWYLVKAAVFVIASLVFSVIFWATKQWYDQPRKKKK